MSDHTRNLKHTARLIVLLHADDLGQLEFYTCQEIADCFDIHKSTISVDLNHAKLKNLP